MALQSSGAISINDIRVELGQGQLNSSLRSLSSLAGKSTPDAMSEFYGFSSATEFQISEIGFPDGEQCCVEGPNYGTGVVYSASTSLGVNVPLFTNSSLTEIFDGNNKWWFSSGKSYLINETGKITEVFIC
jgi:hypothetical protein